MNYMNKKFFIWNDFFSEKSYFCAYDLLALIVLFFLFFFIFVNLSKADWVTESPQNYPYDVYYYACKHDTYNCDEIDYDYYKDGEFFYRYQPNDSEPCRYTRPWYIYNSDVPLDMTTGTWQVKEYRRSNRMFFCQSGSFVMQGEACNAPTSTPENFTASTTETNITLAWDSVYNANFYNLARDTSTNTIATTSSLYFMDEDIECDTVYNYFVQAENECGTSTYSQVVATSSACQTQEPTGSSSSSVMNLDIYYSFMGYLFILIMLFFLLVYFYLLISTLIL